MTKTIFEVNEKEYELKFGINALVAMEEKTGMTITEAGETGGIKFLRTMFTYGLRHQNSKLTEKQAGDLMDGFIEEHGMNELNKVIGSAIEKLTGGGATPSDE